MADKSLLHKYADVNPIKPWRVVDLAGMKFNSLTAIKFIGIGNQNLALWLCRCDCGGYRVSSNNTLKSNLVKECTECVGFNDPIRRFWESVDKRGEDKCWLWKRSPNDSGYGILPIKRGRMLAHRFSYELHREKIPAGMLILHSCDVPLCVNPKHLRIGTDRENTNDKMERRRFRSVLTVEQVRQIKNDMRNGVRNYIIASKYNIGRTTISMIKSGRQWGHVK